MASLGPDVRTCTWHTSRSGRFAPGTVPWNRRQFFTLTGPDALQTIQTSRPAGNQASIPQTRTSVVSRWLNECGALAEWYWQANIEVLGEKSCPGATLCITNLRSIGLRLNQGLRFERPATNRLTHETSEFSWGEGKESRLILKKKQQQQHRRATVSVSRMEGACKQAAKLRLR